MGGMSRSNHETQCGVSCKADKAWTAVKGVFTEKPKAYDKHDQPLPTSEQDRDRKIRQDEQIKVEGGA